MAADVKLTGIVLSSMPVGDYDRRLSVLTCERGRISAFARGARRPKSQLMGASQPFTYGCFRAYEGRDSYSIAAVENPVYFDELCRDPEIFYYASYFCELMEYLTRENTDEKEQVKLLYCALAALKKKNMPATLVRRTYEIRALANYGVAPNIFECNDCRKREGINRWNIDVRRGIIRCEQCSRHADKTANCLDISEAARYTMHYCITQNVGKLFGFLLKDEVWNEFNAVMDKYMKINVDKDMKSLELLI